MESKGVGSRGPDARGLGAKGVAKRARETSSIEIDVEEVKQALSVSDDYLVLGIDEAGRGPLIGPMVYTGAMISLAEHDRLVDYCRVADSKMLSKVNRQETLKCLGELKTFQSFTVSITPDEIAAAMTGRHGCNLNTLSHETAIDIISKATLAGKGKLCAAYIDTVGPPVSYQNRLSGRFPHLRITVSKKADSKFPIVSAASIVAKITRDEAVESLGVAVGSGYPSDPRAISWVRSHIHRFFVVRDAHRFVRQSWGPVAQLAKTASVCVPVTFAQDVEAEQKKGRGGASDPKQKTISFAKAPLARCSFFTHTLKLAPVTSIE